MTPASFLVAPSWQSPLAASVAILLGAIALCWILQTLTTNYSWVDRLWSLMPPLYLAVFVAFSHGHNARLDLMMALAFGWGARLTFNFARKGGYDPREEDYRWAFVRNWLKEHDPANPLGREVFSLVFIALYQHLLIAAFCVPAAAYVFSRGDSQALGGLDFLAAAAFLGFLALETVADQQQWRFHQAKKGLDPEQRTARGGDIARGFNTEGLFAWSRHPNFFSEQMMWWMFAMYPILAGAPLVNVTLMGPVFLSLLFQGSTWFTELISSGKYPAYVEYQRTTSRLVPWPPRATAHVPTESRS